MILIFVLLLAGFFISPAPAAAAETIEFRHYNVGDGLSQNTISAISQDLSGFLWFGTSDGLNRFDGYTFEHYRPEAFDSMSLSGRDVSALLHDHTGRLWVGTLYSGLNLMDHTGRFYHFRQDVNQPYSLSQDSVTTLYEDSEHRIWVGTTSGLNLIELPAEADSLPADSWAGKVRFHHYNAGERTDALSDDFITCIMMDNMGLLWVGTENGLNVADPDSMKFIRFVYSSKNPKGMAYDIIRSLFQDIAGQIWIGTEYGGLNRLMLPVNGSMTVRQRLSQAEFRHYLPGKDQTGNISSDVVFAIYEDHPGFLWLGTLNGLNRFDINGEIFQHWEHDPDDPASLNNNVIYSILKDHSGLFWLGTDGGLNTFHEKQKRFSKIQYHPEQANSLSHPYVWAFAEDQTGKIWVGTEGGINRFNPVTGTLRQFLADPKNPSGPADNRILALEVDSDNTLWIGYNGMGLDRAVLRPDEPPRFIHMDCSENGLNSDYILTIYEDRDGALWIGTWDHGLRKILPEDRHRLSESETVQVPMIQFNHDPGNPNSMSPNRIYTIFQDHTGALWIGTDGDGLNVLSPEHVRVEDPVKEPVQFAHFRHNPQDPGSLSHNIVMSIDEDAGGNLWFGTYGGGLCHFIRQENRFEHFTVADGLPNDFVYGVRIDNSGFLWLSTNKGLAKFDPENRLFNVFTIHDGLQDYEFNSGAVVKTSDGTLFFGGINGLNYFNPDQIAMNAYVPPVVISKLMIDNQAVPVPEDLKLSLSYKQNLVSIDYAAMNMIIPEKNRYQYRLLPVDHDWVDAGLIRQVTYTHLAPGDYLFQVRGSNNDGIWNQEGITLQINVKPPFWQTLWFRLPAAFLILGLIILIYHFRMRSIQRRNRILEERVQERTDKLEAANYELTTTLEEIRTLEGLLPICASCKKIRDDEGTWHQIEVYIREHSDVKFSHGLCPECYKQYDSEI